MTGDVILLLGVKLENGRATAEMRARCECAAKCYFERSGARIIACGGVAREDELSEAAAMRELLTNMGVPERDILIEGTSRITAQNIMCALRLLTGAERQHLVLVTSDYHMPRARLTLKRYGARAMCRAAKIPFSREKMRKVALEVLFIADLLLGYQDMGASRPAWTRMIMRLLGQDKT